MTARRFDEARARLERIASNRPKDIREATEALVEAARNWDRLSDVWRDKRKLVDEDRRARVRLGKPDLDGLASYDLTFESELGRPMPGDWLSVLVSINGLEIRRVGAEVAESSSLWVDASELGDPLLWGRSSRETDHPPPAFLAEGHLGVATTWTTPADIYALVPIGEESGIGYYCLALPRRSTTDDDTAATTSYWFQSREWSAEDPTHVADSAAELITDLADSDFSTFSLRR